MERLELAHAHAPTLILALLFGGAALVVVTPHARLSWLVGVLAAAAACAVAFSAAVSALLGRTEIAAPASEVFTFDGVAAFSAPLIVTLAAAALLAAGPALRSMIGRAAPFALALTLCTAGGWAGARRRGSMAQVRLGPAVLHEYFNRDAEAFERQYIAYMNRLIDPDAGP
jgi:hypothetical protein